MSPREWIGKLWKLAVKFTQTINLPVITGIGITVLGGLMLLLSLKGSWYAVPFDLTEDDALVTKGSPWEMRTKIILLLGLLICAALWFWKRSDALFRAKVQFSLGLLAFLLGLAFSHFTIINSADISHRAAWILSQHDNLTWLGGDIYTGREYEQVGGGLDLMAKDPQQLIGSVPLPYASFDLGTMHDFFDWMGLGDKFTAFKGKGWGFLMVGSILFMVGSLCTRVSTDTSRLSGAAVSGCLRIATPAVLIFLGLITARVYVSAQALESAHIHGDNADYSLASESIDKAIRWMPCLQYDSGIILQQGLYQHQKSAGTPLARYYRAVLLETANLKSQAEATYIELTRSDCEPVRREALRAIFRLGIIDFNSGQETEALRRTESLLHEFPVLQKARYMRLLLAVRLGEREVARRCQQQLYAVAAGISLPEQRAYLSSGHQHLLDLAYTDGEFQEAWQESVNRVQLNK